MLAFYRRFVVQGNVVVGIAGRRRPPERAPELAARLVGGLPAGSAPPDAVPEPTMRPGGGCSSSTSPSARRRRSSSATLGTSAHDDDHVPLVVANAVFGGTFTSRLMREVRSKRGWSYGASARTVVDRRRQAWVMWTFPAAEDAAPCLKLTLELHGRRGSTGGVTPREVAFIQRYLVRSHAFDIDTAAKRLHQALDVELPRPPGRLLHVVDRPRARGDARGRERRGAGTASTRSDLLAVVVGTAAQVLEPARGRDRRPRATAASSRSTRE